MRKMVRQKVVFVYRKFDGKKFRLWATADSKSTADRVADAKRNPKSGLRYYARITKTNNKKRPYKIWIRARRKK